MLSVNQPMILDIEVFPNYNLFAFRKNGKLKTFESTSKFSKKDKAKIKKLLNNNLIVTFNGNKYDMPLVNYAVVIGATVDQMYRASKAIIEDKMNIYAFYKKAGLHRDDLIECDHVDIIEVAPQTASLKAYGARIHSEKLWDLPFDPHINLTKKEMKTIRDYCENDLIVTEQVFTELIPQLELREKMSKEYEIDLRSKSDAQIAEAVMVSELAKIDIKAERPRLESDYRCKYVAPKYIKFKSKHLKALLKKVTSIEFGLQANGSVQLPASLTQELIHIGNTTYKIGIGGLHSQEKSLTVTKNRMMNADYASYYPAMILENKYYPKQLSEKFLGMYGKIRDERLVAKAKIAELKQELKDVKNHTRLSK